ncbi:hypothetical protein H6B30_07300 [Marseilla massiliensis]|uniref:Uncharacterized protein n=1 Tax=Marseilla massiliensis TaxID=1841864 RepID=A0A938WMJ5_9BACT|nr:hypothetical protein [Marseilla massiliensis]
MMQTPAIHALMMMKHKQKPMKRKANTNARRFNIFATRNKTIKPMT